MRSPVLWVRVEYAAGQLFGMLHVVVQAKRRLSLWNLKNLHHRRSDFNI